MIDRLHVTHTFANQDKGKDNIWIKEIFAVSLCFI